MSKIKALVPRRDETVINGDGTLNRRYMTYLELLTDNQSGDIDDIEGIQAAIFGWLAPALNQLGAQIVAKCKRIDDQEQLIASLMARIGSNSSQIAGLSKTRTIRFETVNYPMIIRDSGVIADATSGALTTTLPDATQVRDLNYFVQKADFAANAVTVDTLLSQTINGSSTSVIVNQYDTAVYKSDGFNWIIT